MQNSVKFLAQVQVDGVIRSSLIHQCWNSTVEGHQICQALFALSEAKLSVTSQPIIVHVT